MLYFVEGGNSNVYVLVKCNQKMGSEACFPRKILKFMISVTVSGGIRNYIQINFITLDNSLD